MENAGCHGMMHQKRKGSVIGLTRIAAKLCLFPFFKIEARGRELLPETGPFVLLPKHQRWEDIPILALAASCPLYYVAKYELFNNSLSRWFMTSLGGIPLNRRRPMETRDSIRSMLACMEGGEGMVIFPEGTYYRNRVGPGHVGLIRMIHSRMALPFIPVGIRYERKGARVRARVAFGSPAHFDRTADANEILGHMMKEIGRLSGFQETVDGASPAEGVP